MAAVAAAAGSLARLCPLARPLSPPPPRHVERAERIRLRRRALRVFVWLSVTADRLLLHHYSPSRLLLLLLSSSSPALKRSARRCRCCLLQHPCHLRPVPTTCACGAVLLLSAADCCWRVRPIGLERAGLQQTTTRHNNISGRQATRRFDARTVRGAARAVRGRQTARRSGANLRNSCMATAQRTRITAELHRYELMITVLR